ncbi:MAG TPA: threonine aldolase, partial [Chitinophagales bacterium]|nr:threonine aldolase [Chitinophagales bacterium]
ARLAEDHARAGQLAAVVAGLPWVKKVLPVQTNIVIFEVADAQAIAEVLKKEQILIQPFSPTLLRMVTHLDFTDEMMDKVKQLLSKLKV